jgi:internalin A
MPPRIHEAISRAASSRARSLDLRRARLGTELPERICQLTSLQELTLGDTQLTTLPAEIAQLANLQRLDLSNTPLRELPPEIGALANLRSLNLSGTQLTALPAEIGQLRKLEKLDVSVPGLRALPREIGRLQRLDTLTLIGTQLRHLPVEIGQLSALEFLTVSSPRLRTLPEEIGRLRSLQFLSLGGTQLRTLPPEIGRLGNLQSLTCVGTQLTMLAAEIGQLESLRFLDLRDNQLASLPAEIGQLSRLQLLDLRGNRLTSLPREVAGLPETLSLRLAGNPLVEPFADLTHLEVRDLFAYLRSLDTAEPIFEAKVLLVGEGNVGKSSLLSRLRDEEFVENRPTTHGIELDTLRLPHPTLPVDITLNTWDFGGQEVYRITHQFFFSPRALYLLVWRPREGQEENAVEGWLRRIRLRIGEDARIMVVATHCDEREPDLDYPSLKRRYGAIICGSYAIDNRSGTGVEELRQAIAAEAALLPDMGQMVSTRWIRARDEVTSTMRPQMAYTQYLEVCRRHALDEGAAAALARLLHERGVVIHYGDDDGLRDIIVVQPEWLTRAISYVLADAPTRRADGRLEHARLREIWQERTPGEAYAPTYHPYFLRLMEKFEVSYRFPDDEKASLVAQLVPFQQPDPPWDDVDLGLHRLALVCRMSDEAPGLVPWLIVRNHRFSTGRHWRHGVFLEHAAYHSRALFHLHEDRRHLTLSVAAPAPEYFFHILRDGLEYLISQRWPGLRHAILIPCPGRQEDGTSCPGCFDFAVLERHRLNQIATIRCYECLREHSVSELLTGFASPELPVLDVLHAQHRDVMTGLRHLDREVSQVGAVAAEIASRVRIVLRIVGTEVTDCPRLFTIDPVAPHRRVFAKAAHEVLRLTLWCEHPDHWHPWEPATYHVTRPRRWLVSIAPYVRVVVRMLRLLAPVTGAVPGLLLDEGHRTALEPKLAFMERLVAAIPADECRLAPLPGASQLTQAEGAALRALRTLLLEEDRVRAFGSLRRRRTPDGAFVWICPEHYPAYDPGLPDLD